MLRGGLEGAQALDLFGGTGALGIEALSSGAECVIFVEMEKAQALAIENNLERLGLSQKGEVINAQAIRAIEKLSHEKRRFDLIFIDPPYEKGLGAEAMAAISKSKILKKDGLIIFECRESEALPNIGADFTCLKNKVYGDTRIIIYRA